ncbi:MAG TPA: glycerophosphodiester phosphodiesterase family protein [Flavobacterium lutivivi]|nr:glycerophosphodiester phosphodiesterase family protein [Flavobacterium lutivivi]
MLKIGHRGAKGHAAENTIASFQKAIELGVDMIELDVHLSKDGIPVVIHDETIDRTTHHSGFVNQFTAEFLQSIGVPSLRDVFDLVENQCAINIEIKVFEATKPVLEVLKNAKFPQEKIIISSFDWDVLNVCHCFASSSRALVSEEQSISLGVLTEVSIQEALTFAKKINAYSINPYFKLLNPENVKDIHQNGFKVFPWTVNNPDDITFVKSLNVDGIISDFPDRL